MNKNECTHRKKAKVSAILVIKFVVIRVLILIKSSKYKLIFIDFALFYYKQANNTDQPTYPPATELAPPSPTLHLSKIVI